MYDLHADSASPADAFSMTGKPMARASAKAGEHRAMALKHRERSGPLLLHRFSGLYLAAHLGDDITGRADKCDLFLPAAFGEQAVF